MARPGPSARRRPQPLMSVGANMTALGHQAPGIGPRRGRGQGVGLVRLGVTPTLQRAVPDPVSRALGTMVWDGKMVACLTPSLRSTWPVSRRAGTIQGAVAAGRGGPAGQPG